MTNATQPSRKPQVALFITCLSDQFFPRVGVAVTKILERFGCTVEFPAAQTCCGQPIFNNGFHAEARQLAKRHVEIFEPYEFIVTPSGSCCAMIREYYPQLLGGEAAWEAGMRRVCQRTYEFVEFLHKVLKADLSAFALPQRQTVTYHYTCHQRGLGLSDEAVRLLNQIGNVQFVAMERADQCCGFGGTFAVKYPVISGAMVQDKTDCIAKTAAQTLVCNDAGCTMNIGGMLHRRGMPMRVKHIAEVMAEAMGIDLDAW